MTGIKERHWADDDQDTSDLAYEASVKAIATLVFSLKI